MESIIITPEQYKEYLKLKENISVKNSVQIYVSNGNYLQHWDIIPESIAVRELTKANESLKAQMDEFLNEKSAIVETETLDKLANMNVFNFLFWKKEN